MTSERKKKRKKKKEKKRRKKKKEKKKKKKITTLMGLAIMLGVPERNVIRITTLAGQAFEDKCHNY